MNLRTALRFGTSRFGLARFGLLTPVLVAGGLLVASHPARSDGGLAPVDAVAALCEDGQCQPVISETEFFGRTAYRLTDGKTEAIVVPQIGRVMKFGRVGGPNLLWNAPTPKGLNMDWINYGGDKNWLWPQSEWPKWNASGKGWPPDTAWDGQPQTAEVLSGGKLRMTSPVSAGTGVRFVRTMYFNTQGEFVIEQTAQKVKGKRVRAGIWSITQTAPGQAIFVPTTPPQGKGQSYLLLSKSQAPQKLDAPKTNLLRITPKPSGGGWKIANRGRVSSVASVSDGVAFVQRATAPPGDYAKDGPVELYVNGDPKVYYYEMELLSPLRTFNVGQSWSYTVHWSLHDLPSGDVNSSEVVDAVAALLALSAA